MKKLLLSSIIMFGICGFVTAQNATGSNKLGKTTSTGTTSVAPTPKKSATEATASVTTNSDQAIAADKVNAPAAAPVATGKPARVAKTDAATAIAADGTVTDAPKTREAAVKPTAPVRKN